MSGSNKKFVYVLELENNKKYVGLTDDPDNRICKHINGDGSEWTKINKPKRTLEVIENGNENLELITTLDYMYKYGIRNVRGGPFVQKKLWDTEMHIICKMLRHKYNACVKCGKNDHYCKSCKELYHGPTDRELNGPKPNSEAPTELIDKTKSLLGKRKEREEDIPEKNLPEEESVQEPPTKKAKNDDKNNHS